MISQAHRFHGRNSLRFVYQRGQQVRGGALSLRYASNPRRQSYRMAVVVSRKVCQALREAHAIGIVLREVFAEARHVRVHHGAAKFFIRCDLARRGFQKRRPGEELADWPHTELRRVITSLLAKAGALRDIRPSHAIVKGKEIDT